MAKSLHYFIFLILAEALSGWTEGKRDVLHRPGALFVRRGTVSLSGSVYRVLIHLHPYFYETEIGAMTNFLQNSSTLLSNVKSGLDPTTIPQELQQTIEAFQSQVTRAQAANADLVTKSNVLKELFPSPVSGTKKPNNPGLSRPFRQDSVANFFGLASYNQVRDLQSWAASAAETSEQILHVAEEQYSFINKTANKVNQHETRLNQLTELAVEYASRLNVLAQASSAIDRLKVVQGSMFSLLKGSIAMLEYMTELRLLLDEELERSRELIRGRVPLSLLSPSEFHQIMQTARGTLPSTYSFSASPADMALSLSTAKITVITRGEVSPYYGVLEFPIHRDVFELYQIQTVRVADGSNPAFAGLYEIGNPLLAVQNNKNFVLEFNELRDCLTSQLPLKETEDEHFCTPVTSVYTYERDVPPNSCAAAVYYESRYVSDLCPQSATIAEDSVFRHIQQNQWTYSSPNPAHMLRVFCPPDWVETHSSMPLNPSGGLLQIPEGCSGRYGQVILPATYGVQTRFRVSEPVHRPFPRLQSEHWRPILVSSSLDATVVNKLRDTLRNSSQLKMPLKQFSSKLDDIKVQMTRSKFDAIYHAPSFAPTVSVSTVAFVALMLIIGLLVLWVRRRRPARIPALPVSAAASIATVPELAPLQPLTGPAGSTPFPLPPARRPLPAPPLSIREIGTGDGEGTDDEMPRPSRRSRRSRRMR